MRKIAGLIVIFLGIIAEYNLLHTLTFAESSPQQAAGAAMAMAIVVIPYCIFNVGNRVVDLYRPEKKDTQSNMESDEKSRAEDGAF